MKKISSWGYLWVLEFQVVLVLFFKFFCLLPVFWISRYFQCFASSGGLLQPPRVALDARMIYNTSVQHLLKFEITCCLIIWFMSTGSANCKVHESGNQVCFAHLCDSEGSVRQWEGALPRGMGLICLSTDWSVCVAGIDPESHTTGRCLRGK